MAAQHCLSRKVYAKSTLQVAGSVFWVHTCDALLLPLGPQNKMCDLTPLFFITGNPGSRELKNRFWDFFPFILIPHPGPQRISLDKKYLKETLWWPVGVSGRGPKRSKICFELSRPRITCDKMLWCQIKHFVLMGHAWAPIDKALIIEKQKAKKKKNNKTTT